MRIIAVVNQKGGCGKTTVSINLASALAELGQKTLLVDMDSQSHCAVGLAVPEDQIELSIYDVLISKSRNEPIKLTEILWQISDKLELAPASVDLSAFEQQMSGINERELCLQKVLADVKTEFDYVIIDCPPAISLLTFNALRAATDVIIPVETGYFALHGLSRQLETLNVLCERCQQQINVKILANMYDIRTKMAREILAELKQHFMEKMFRTTVNFNTKIREAASFGQPINEYEPSSKGHMDFKALAEEVINSQMKQQRHGLVNSLAGQLEVIGKTADELLATTTPQKKQKTTEEITIAVASSKKEEPEVRLEKPVATPPEIKVEVQPEPQLEKQLEELPIELEIEEPQLEKPKGLNAKLSDYYGVSQVKDAVVFVTLYPRAKTVQIAADFNNWQPGKTSMQKVGTSGIWQTKIKLPAGKHHYRLVVDGQWQQDPYNKTTELNPYGELNSIIEVK